jgi:hypothetical protein
MHFTTLAIFVSSTIAVLATPIRKVDIGTPSAVFNPTGATPSNSGATDITSATATRAPFDTVIATGAPTDPAIATDAPTVTAPADPEAPTTGVDPSNLVDQLSSILTSLGQLEQGVQGLLKGLGAGGGENDPAGTATVTDIGTATATSVGSDPQETGGADVTAVDPEVTPLSGNDDNP